MLSRTCDVYQILQESQTTSTSFRILTPIERNKMKIEWKPADGAFCGFQAWKYEDLTDSVDQDRFVREVQDTKPGAVMIPLPEGLRHAALHPEQYHRPASPSSPATRTS